MTLRKNKIKILYVITKSNWGGAQRYVFDLATNVNLKTVDTAVALGGSGELQKRLAVNHVRTISIPNLERDINIFKEIFLFFTLYRLYYAEQPDIIHLNSSKIGGIGSLAGRIYNIFSHRKTKIIFTAHGWAFNEDRNVLVKKIIFFISFITALCSHAVITVSLHDEHALRMPFISKKIFTIYNGIAVPQKSLQTDARRKLLSFLPNLSQKTREFLFHPKTRWIGTIAELHTNKGLPYALRAINTLTVTLPNIVYIIIGEGELRRDIERYINDTNLHGHVFLTGHIPDAGKYVHAFDIFLLPSIKEGLPYVLLESAHAAVPVVATAVGGIREIIEHEQGGMLARPKHSKDIEYGLKYMLIEESRREKMGAYLCTHAQKNFTLENMLEKTWNLYRALLKM